MLGDTHVADAGALLRHGIYVQTASFLFVSEAFDEKVVAEAARRWERAVSEVYGLRRCRY